ncbi:MAG: bifunctional diaminohydroxyphosphoribosylaminopyrimidine deaminase/5-amino-6-(5-phosphoribosylamino)uracil reductase RibD [Muribaculaceae bacterium]|nr:bifunctional diaminohydroxyphosphoribosylaminopyrimidine deaminase/5-amino-6-(5-phosphoribosylamino)uracil reductase RibD [Muribaculaceae bacterium]
MVSSDKNINTPMPTKDERYMRRALDLASSGAGHVSPNPMVGAVIVAPDGRIIGEGFHRRYGEGHAEVNAIASVAEEDIPLLRESTIYVTLEPCSHYGKTPPCAKLLCDKGVKRCVIGTGDPNPKVAGRGIKMLRDAGIEVTENVLKEECLAINERFFTAQTQKRPWILLKWAENSDGSTNAPDGSPIAISSPATRALMHRERSLCDAIMVGTGTLLSDNPSLTTRHWPGKSPIPVIFSSERIENPEVRANLKIFNRRPIILDADIPLEENMKILFEHHGITSLMVEGGPTLIKSFIDAGLYDRIRTERNESI